MRFRSSNTGLSDDATGIEKAAVQSRDATAASRLLLAVPAFVLLLLVVYLGTNTGLVFRAFHLSGTEWLGSPRLLTPGRMEIAPASLPDHVSWGRLRHQRHRDRGLEGRLSYRAAARSRGIDPTRATARAQSSGGRSLQARSPPLI